MKSKKTVVLLFILAIVVRLPFLTGSFWLDEAAQALESARPLSQQHLIQGDFQPPFFHYVIHYMTLLSRSEWVLRLPSLGAGIATIFFLYLIGKERFSQKIGAVGAFFLAISPLHIYLSQELRPYAFAALFVTASWYFLLTKAYTSRFRWMGFSLSTVAGLYSLYIHPFFLLSQLLYVLVESRGKLRSFLFSSFLAGIVFLPWFPYFLGQLQVGTALTKNLPGWSEVVATPQMKALPLTILKLITGQVYLRDSLVVTICALLMAILWGVAFLYTARNPKHRFIWYWIVFPILLTWTVSFFVPVIAPKRLLGTLPALLLVCANVYGVLDQPKKILAKGILLFVTLISFFFIGIYWTTPKYQREPWREVIARVESLADIPSVALFAFPAQLAPWDWYSSGKVRPWSTGSISINSATALDERLKPVITDQQVFYFHYLSDLTDPAKLTEQWLKERSWEQIDQIDGGPLGFVSVFDRMKAQ